MDVILSTEDDQRRSLRCNIDTHFKGLDIPVVVSIKFSVDDGPAHGILDNIEVVWYIVFRNRILEIILPIETLKTLHD